MSSLHRGARLQAGAMFLLAVGAGAAFWVGEGLGTAIPIFAIIAAYVALLAFGRTRSASLEVLGGLGDERTTALYQRAVAFAGTVMAFVLPVWWLVTVAQGDADIRLAGLCGIFGLSFIGAAFYFARRG